MGVTKKELQKYFQQIKAELFCPHQMRKRIMDDLKGNVFSYLEEHPEATAEAIRESFGSPAQIAASYLEELPTPELIQKLKLRNRILKSIIAIICGVALILLLVWGIAILVALEKVENQSDPYYEIITEEELL